MRTSSKRLHILIIFLGSLFILAPAFHINLWFDESYSVALAKHDIFSIWRITAHDVHPPLYYWLLHVIYLIFGSNILAFRLFSAIGIITEAVLGYTHIRKDFGAKTGIFFSFLSLFLPVMCTYAGEIRMYSWACVLVTLMSIYGYRFFISIKNGPQSYHKSLTVFIIFSMASCYIHYYGVVAAFLENLLLLIYIFKNKKQLLKTFCITSVIQVAIYLPWLFIFFFSHIIHGHDTGWIYLDPVITPFQIISAQYNKFIKMSVTLNIYTVLAFVFSILLYWYIFNKTKKYKKERADIEPFIISGKVYLGVILIILIISFVLPLLFSRYLMVINGLYIFALAYMLSMEKNKKIIALICGIILVLSSATNISEIRSNYDTSNMKQIDYIKENIEDEDIFLYSDIGSGGVIAVNFPQNKQYFWNKKKMGCEGSI